MSVPLTAYQVWSRPVLLGLLSGVGLVSALLGDGVWDTVSWVTLGIPVLISVWCGVRCQSR